MHPEESEEKHNEDLNNTFTTTKEDMNVSSITARADKKIQIKKLDDLKKEPINLKQQDRSKTPVRIPINNQAAAQKQPVTSRDTKASGGKSPLPERSKTPVREKPLVVAKKEKPKENNLNKSAIIESNKNLDKTIEIEKDKENKQSPTPVLDKKRESVLKPSEEKRSSLYMNTRSSLLKSHANVQNVQNGNSIPNGTAVYHSEREKRKSSVIVEGKRNSLLNSVDRGARKGSVVGKSTSAMVNNESKRKSTVETKVVRRESTLKETKDIKESKDLNEKNNCQGEEAQKLESSEKTEKSENEKNEKNDSNEGIDVGNNANEVIESKLN